MSEGSDRSLELDDIETMDYVCVCLLEKGWW